MATFWLYDVCAVTKWLIVSYLFGERAAVRCAKVKVLIRTDCAQYHQHLNVYLIVILNVKWLDRIAAQ